MIYLSFIFQLAPIFICAGIMLLLKTAKFTRQKITIVNNSDCTEDSGSETITGNIRSGLLAKLPVTSSEADVRFKDVACWHNYLADFDNMRNMTFVRVAYDALILNGIAKKCEPSPKEIEDEAFDKLGLMDLHNLGNLENYVKRSKKDNITIFVIDTDELFRCFTRPEFGLLLAYMIDYNMSVYHECPA